LPHKCLPIAYGAKA
jgi:hypothetical protein